MTFLNPLFLVAIPLVSAPVLIHLLRRKQRRVVSWGAMQFLTDAVNRGRSFDRIEEWLLMLLRVAAIAALVFALARPLITGWSTSDTANREVVVIVDDSLSTDLTTSAGKVFDVIRTRAKQFIEKSDEYDQIHVMLAGGGPRWLVEKSELSREMLSTELDGVVPTEGTANMLSCLQLAASFTSPSSGSLPRHVVVFTDAQQHGWNAESKAIWEKLAASTAEVPYDVTFEIVNCAAQEEVGVNLAVSPITSSKAAIAAGVPFTLQTTVRNTGTRRAPATTISWKAGDRELKRSKIPPLPAGQSHAVEATLSFDELAIHNVKVSIDLDDALSLDNHAHHVVETVESIPILVISESAKHASRDNLFFAESLGGEDRGQSQGSRQFYRWKSVYRPTFQSVAEINKADISKFNVVVLTSVDDVPLTAIESLEAYVRGGGGLWIMLGPRIDRESFNRRFHRDGAGLCPLPLAALRRVRNAEASEAFIHPPSRDHAATSTLADTDRLDIDEVQLSRYYTFRQPEGLAFTSLLKSGRGSPLCLLNFMGKGRIIVQAFPLRANWSDLPVSKAFVVLVQDWLTYLTEPMTTELNLSPREPLLYTIGASLDVEQGQVVLPNGTTAEATAVRRDDRITFRFTHTGLPGSYQLRCRTAEKWVEVPFQVARELAESDLAMLDEETLESIEGSLSGRPDMARAAASTQSSGEGGSPVWWALLVAMLCFMAAESLLASRVSVGRFGLSSS